METSWQEYFNRRYTGQLNPFIENIIINCNKHAIASKKY